MQLVHPEVGRYLEFAPQFWLQWHITDRCNGRCAHCYLTERRRDLERPELARILERYRGFLARRRLPGRLQIAGGEPLAHPGLDWLLTQAREARLPVRLLSSGRGLSERRAQELAGLGLAVVQISVEGTREQHDAMRGAGTYDAAVRACRALSAVGVEVTVACTLHRGNLDALATLLTDFAGIARRVHGARLVPVGEGAELAAGVLSASEWRAAMDGAVARTHQPGLPELLLRDPTWIGRELDGRRGSCLSTVGGCSAGYHGICVDTDGTVFPCRRLPIPVGNLLTQEIEEVLAHPLMVALRDRDRLEGACGRCGLRWQCGGCRAVAAAVGGSPLAADPQCPWSAWHRLPGVTDVLGRWWRQRAARSGAEAAE